MVFSNTARLQQTSLLRRASLCGVIISDRSALEISSRGSSTLTSEFSASEIFVQRLPGSSVTSLQRRWSEGDSALPPPVAPAKTMLLRRQQGWPHVCDTCASVMMLVSLCQGWDNAAALSWLSQPHQRWEGSLGWPEQFFQPLGLPPQGLGGLRYSCWLPATELIIWDLSMHTKILEMGLFNKHLWADGSSSLNARVICGVDEEGMAGFRQHPDWKVTKGPQWLQPYLRKSFFLQLCLPLHH